MHKIADTVLGTYFLAVGEKHPTAAYWDRLAFLKRSGVTLAKAKLYYLIIPLNCVMLKIYKINRQTFFTGRYYPR